MGWSSWGLCGTVVVNLKEEDRGIEGIYGLTLNSDIDVLYLLD